MIKKIKNVGIKTKQKNHKMFQIRLKNSNSELINSHENSINNQRIDSLNLVPRNLLTKSKKRLNKSRLDLSVLSFQSAGFPNLNFGHFEQNQNPHDLFFHLNANQKSKVCEVSSFY